MRVASKIDRTQPAIVQALRASGAEVQILSSVGNGCVDLLVAYRGQWFVGEVKTVGYRWSLTPAEVEWHERFGQKAPVYIWEDEEQALRAIGAII